MHRAKGDRLVRASVLPVCDNDGIRFFLTDIYNLYALCNGRATFNTIGIILESIILTVFVTMATTFLSNRQNTGINMTFN